jgi:hypothetical protein
MNLLITTLGMSWQIVPELLAFTNPRNYDFFRGNREAEALREASRIEPVDECWVITVGNQGDLGTLRAWGERWKIPLRIAWCRGVSEFSTQEELHLMRSFIYRVVLARFWRGLNFKFLPKYLCQ